MAEDVVIIWPHSVELKYLQESVTVQGFIRILQFQKYFIQDLLPHGHKLLEQFVFKGCGPSATTFP